MLLEKKNVVFLSIRRLQLLNPTWGRHAKHADNRHSSTTLGQPKDLIRN